MSDCDSLVTEMLGLESETEAERDETLIEKLGALAVSLAVEDGELVKVELRTGGEADVVFVADISAENDEEGVAPVLVFVVVREAGSDGLLDAVGDLEYEFVASGDSDIDLDCAFDAERKQMGCDPRTLR